MENFHLTQEDGKYKLKKEGAERSSKVFDTNKIEAIKSAKDFIVSHNGGSLRIHKNSGEFQEERTYPRSKDPKKSKG
ncbi:DUF2188 domain-containing protein [Chryseobacterium sp. SIMBA_038]|uniref:DUF2188 domain-containing protein n=1 Tax=Chryseobacterium sp. SIMBA_038 TaxID=3085780 RepID=UPI00397D492C